MAVLELELSLELACGSGARWDFEREYMKDCKCEYIALYWCVKRYEGKSPGMVNVRMISPHFKKRVNSPRASSLLQ